MRLELKEFIEAAAQIHQRSGIKRTRLMLRLRPQSTKRTFIVKCTDGRNTVTTRVEHQGQLKMVESLLNDFVTRCTADSMPVAQPQQQQQQHNTAPPASNNNSTQNNNNKPAQQQQQQQKGGGKSGKKGKR